MNFHIKEPHLQLFLRILDGNQEQLIMCVPGSGGTGKSQLMRAITTSLKQIEHENYANSPPPQWQQLRSME